MSRLILVCLLALSTALAGSAEAAKAKTKPKPKSKVIIPIINEGYTLKGAKTVLDDSILEYRVNDGSDTRSYTINSKGLMSGTHLQAGDQPFEITQFDERMVKRLQGAIDKIPAADLKLKQNTAKEAWCDQSPDYGKTEGWGGFKSIGVLVRNSKGKVIPVSISDACGTWSQAGNEGSAVKAFVEIIEEL